MNTINTTVLIIAPTAADEWLVCWTVQGTGTRVLWIAHSRDEAEDFIKSVARYGL